MATESGQGFPLPWKSQKQQLRRDGHLLRYKMNTKQIPRQVLAYPLPQAYQYAIVRLNPEHEQEGIEEQTRASAPAPSVDRRDMLTHGAGQKFSSLVLGQIGGLRGDPFNAFPIASQNHVASAFDYFAEVYAPFAVPPSLFKVFFQTILHDEMYFEQTIAFSLAAQNLKRLRGGHMPKEVRQHTNNAIMHLRRRLSAKETSDVIILTIMQQAAIQHMAGDSRIFGIHARAVKDLVTLRGGLENLGWDGYVATRAQQVLSAAWRAGGATLDGFWEGKFTYPTHPFPRELARTIARFPPGFRDAALRRELSVQFIDYLDFTLQWMGGKTGEKTLRTFGQHGILGLPKLSHVERLLATAVQAYTNFVERSEHGHRNEAAEQSVQDQIHLLAAREHEIACDRGVLTWVYLMLKATTGDQTESWKWANAWLCSMHVSSQREEELAKLFLPIPATSADVL